MPLLPKPLLHGDRRRVPRIGLDLYGYEHLSLLIIPHQSLEARLLDISPCGARLSLPLAPANLGLCEGDILTFNPRLGGQGPLYRDLTCQVRWFAGWQLGLSLDKNLPVCVTDIFKLLSMVWRA